MRPSAVVVMSVLLIAACRRQPPEALPAASPPISTAFPALFQVNQRSTLALPGSDDRIVIRTADITAGQVETAVAWRGGEAIAPARSMRIGDAITFSVEGHEYGVELKGLHNSLLGHDMAVFELSPATTARAEGLSEDAKIEQLIAALGRLEDVEFVRNGKGYTAAEAVTHLRKKWAWRRTEIKSAQDFIRKVGTGSSASGQPYLIRLSDGSEMRSADWLQAQLQAIEHRDAAGEQPGNQ